MADAEAFQIDTERFTALLSEHVVVVNVAGTRVLGRDALAAAMKHAYSGGRSA